MGLVTLKVIQGDITTQKVDAIVNAANSELLGGGGVDGAIHRAAGPELLAACKNIRNTQGTCAPGNAVISIAGKLPAKYVIHAVGPIWHGGTQHEPDLLASAYHKCFELALNHKLTSIAFPNISTGVYGYPKEQAVQVVKMVIDNFIAEYQASHNVSHTNVSVAFQIKFVCFDAQNYDLYKKNF